MLESDGVLAGFLVVRPLGERPFVENIAMMRENIPFYDGLGFAVSERRLENGYRRIYLEKHLA